MADEPAPTTPVAAQTISGPWAADIQALTNDPNLQAAVDNFMRSKIQPRMTQLEQQVAAAQTAQQLWDAFNTDPEGTYRALTAELYGAEAAEAMLAAVQGGQPAAPAAPAAPAQPAQPAAPAYDPATMLSPQEIEAWRMQQQLAAYDAEIDKIKSDPANADIDVDLLHTYVAAAEGDFVEAIDRYRAGVSQILARYGIDPTTATPSQQNQAAAIATQEAASAPPVMGGDAGGAGAPVPTQPQYHGTEGLSRAIDDFMAGLHGNSEAPPVS